MSIDTKFKDIELDLLKGFLSVRLEDLRPVDQRDLISRIKCCLSDFHGYPPDTPGTTMRLFSDDAFLEYLLEHYGITTVRSDGYLINFKVVDEHKYTVFLLKYL